MTKKTKRHTSAEDKVKAVRAHLIDQKPVSEIAEELGVHPNVYYTWQKQFFENGDKAFKKESVAEKNKQEKKIAKLEAQLQDRNEVISELASEHLAFKKSIGEI